MSVAFVDEQEASAEQDDPLSAEPLVRLAENVLVGESLPGDTEVTITLVSPERMTELNARHMGRQGPTDVLSFPIEDLFPGSPPLRLPDGPPVDIGDVVICPVVVRTNAEERGVAFADEMALMVVHGLLHLLGYDHLEDADAERMETGETAYLAAVGRTRP